MKKANINQQSGTSALETRPDEQIDTSDIPEVTDWAGAVRGLFTRPQTRHVSLRLSTADLVTANRLAAAKRSESVV